MSLLWRSCFGCLFLKAWCFCCWLRSSKYYLGICDDCYSNSDHIMNNFSFIMYNTIYPKPANFWCNFSFYFPQMFPNIWKGYTVDQNKAKHCWWYKSFSTWQLERKSLRNTKSTLYQKKPLRSLRDFWYHFQLILSNKRLFWITVKIYVLNNSWTCDHSWKP